MEAHRRQTSILLLWSSSRSVLQLPCASARCEAIDCLTLHTAQGLYRKVSVPRVDRHARCLGDHRRRTARSPTRPKFDRSCLGHDGPLLGRRSCSSAQNGECGYNPTWRVSLSVFMYNMGATTYFYFLQSRIACFSCATTGNLGVTNSLQFKVCPSHLHPLHSLTIRHQSTRTRCHRIRDAPANRRVFREVARSHQSTRSHRHFSRASGRTSGKSFIAMSEHHLPDMAGVRVV